MSFGSLSLGLDILSRRLFVLRLGFIVLCLSIVIIMNQASFKSRSRKPVIFCLGLVVLSRYRHHDEFRQLKTRSRQKNNYSVVDLIYFILPWSCFLMSRYRHHYEFR